MRDSAVKDMSAIADTKFVAAVNGVEARIHEAKPAGRIIVRPSLLCKGRGVFAVDGFASGAVIEVCPVITLSKKDAQAIYDTNAGNYYFQWEKAGEGAIALGYGSLYNHARPANAQYWGDYAALTMIFAAVRNIARGEEITVNYGGGPRSKFEPWWDDEVASV